MPMHAGLSAAFRNPLNGSRTFQHGPKWRGRGGGKAGRATPDDYSRYVNAYEAVISPRHDKLQRRLRRF
ncbi:MAG: hypothetical protein IPF97_08150 [Sphingomonadales bacterium]|nr:hypothetical protein [Sphingomonadales bacterium]